MRCSRRMNEPSPRPAPPTFGEALKFWWKLGWISFGGPAGQIAIMHREIVERRRWLSEDHFLHALNFCMLLPGPEAQQLATYLGWRLHGAKGGIVAGALFVIPSIFILMGLSWLYVTGANVTWINGLFYGLTAAVIAIVASAVKRIGTKALKTPALWGLALASFIAIFFFKISFVLIILSAALIGWLGGKRFPGQFPAGKGHARGERQGEGERRGGGFDGGHKGAPGGQVHLMGVFATLYTLASTRMISHLTGASSFLLTCASIR